MEAARRERARSVLRGFRAGETPLKAVVLTYPAIDCCKIPISLIGTQKGEEKAHACAIAKHAFDNHAAEMGTEMCPETAKEKAGLETRLLR